MSWSVIGLSVFTIFSTVMSQVIFKSWVGGSGASSVSAGGILSIIQRAMQSPLMIIGVALYGLGFLSWIMLLSRVSLSLVYPLILSVNVVLIMLASVYIFHEPAGMMQVVGTLVIVAGIYLLFF